jgi:DNA-binding transcriptional regulator YhcF (GntR family)
MAKSACVRAAEQPTELVETATGVRYTVRHKRAPDQTFGRRFVVIFDDTAHDLAASISAYAAKVMISLPKRLDWRTWRRLPQADLAAHLSISKSRVCRALRELEEHGVIESRGKGAAVEWRISRVIGFRGRAAQYHSDAREETLDRLDEIEVIEDQVQPSLPNLRTPKAAFGRSRRAAAPEVVH